MTALAPAPMPSPYTTGDTFDPSRVAWMLTEASIAAFEEAVRRSPEIAWDLETTGLNEHEVRESAWGVAARVSLLSATLTDPENGGRDTTWVLPLSHPEGPWRGVWRRVFRRVSEAIQAAEGVLVGHNGKFDLRWTTAGCGVNLAPRYGWDTQVVAHLMDENRSTKLKEVAPATFGVDRWDDHDLDKPGASERVPLVELGLYAARDTYWTWRLYRRQIADLWLDGTDEVPFGPEETLDARLGHFATLAVMPMVRSLSQIEQNGMALDVSWLDEEVVRMHRQRDETFEALVSRYDLPWWLDEAPPRPGAAPEPRLPFLDDAERRALAGGSPSFAPTSKWFTGWAQVAVAAKDLRIDGMTPQGRPQWSRHILKKQAHQGSEVAQVLLDYRHAVKRLEFLTSWRELVSPDGRVHATYNVGRVMTGRLSSSDPNMQQVTKTLKPAYVPSPGHLIAEVDYSQIELRAAAFVAGCEAMLEAYRAGQDLHRLMALRILQDREEKQAAAEEREPVLLTLADVSAADRQAAKASNFGLLYLQSPMGFQTYAEQTYNVILTLEEAETMHGLFFEQWPGMREWQQRMVNTAKRHGYVVSPLGRVRRLPDIDSGSDYLRNAAERQAVNSTVQSFASDLMQMAAADIAGLYDQPAVPDVRLIGTVHDSLVIEVPERDWKRATARVMQRMIRPHRLLERLGCDLTVPLAAEATVGTRWGLGDVGVIA